MLRPSTGDGAANIGGSLFEGSTGEIATLVTRIAVNQEGLLAQVQQTAACNTVHSAVQRLSRWLLQAQKNIADEEIVPFTQEFLSNILDVRRSTVTLIAASLQRAGSIRYTRGRIEILDRPALKRTACEYYEAIRLLGAQAELPETKRRS